MGNRVESLYDVGVAGLHRLERPDPAVLLVQGPHGEHQCVRHRDRDEHARRAARIDPPKLGQDTAHQAHLRGPTPHVARSDPDGQRSASCPEVGYDVRLVRQIGVHREHAVLRGDRLVRDLRRAR